MKVTEYNSNTTYIQSQTLFRVWTNVLFILVTIGCILVSCSDKNSAETNKEANSKTPEIQSDAETAVKTNAKFILFFGNSLSAGYGLDEEFSFPSVIQDKIDSLELNYVVVNAGLSGETTAGGAGRIDWVLNQDLDIFILELGGNDMLRGLSPSETEKNLRKIVSEVRKKNADITILLAGMQAAPNLGQSYTTAFNEVYPALAKELDLILIPSLLKDVGGIKSLNQPDGIHPNEEGAKIVANTIWEYLKPLLKE